MWDVAVIGAGPAGAVAAHVLARAGRKVLLVDRIEGKPRRRKIGESLPGAARPLLGALGLLELVENGPHLLSPGGISAWGSDEMATKDAILDPSGPGWQLDRSRFDHDLRQEAVRSGAEVRQAAVSTVSAPSDHWLVGAEGFEERARWLVNATGRGTLLSQQLGARRLRDDDLVAVYAWIRHGARDRDSRTLVESAREGWWYTSRLPGNIRALVFHTTSSTARQLVSVPGAFRRRLAETTHVRGLVPAKSSPLRLSCTEACGATLDSVAGPGWIAAGDAAMAFDPLSSQGIFNALYTGMKAGQAVLKALEGDPGAVHDYQSRLAEIRQAYVARRNVYYSMERRWLDQPFWSGKSQRFA